MMPIRSYFCTIIFYFQIFLSVAQLVLQKLNQCKLKNIAFLSATANTNTQPIHIQYTYLENYYPKIKTEINYYVSQINVIHIDFTSIDVHKKSCVL